jgi:hypothetical protein
LEAPPVSFPGPKNLHEEVGAEMCMRRLSDTETSGCTRPEKKLEEERRRVEEEIRWRRRRRRKREMGKGGRIRVEHEEEEEGEGEIRKWNRRKRGRGKEGGLKFKLEGCCPFSINNYIEM